MEDKVTPQEEEYVSLLQKSLHLNKEKPNSTEFRKVWFRLAKIEILMPSSSILSCTKRAFPKTEY